MKKLKVILTIVNIYLYSTCLFSCELKEPTNNSDYLIGKWEIEKAKRNGIDISDRFDFRQFRLTLENNRTFELENLVPFLIEENGQWSVLKTNDSKIKFSNYKNNKIGNFTYQTIKNKHFLTISFTSVSNNQYTYRFLKLE